MVLIGRRELIVYALGLCLLVAFITTAGFLAFASWNIFANITTNERINAHKYDYLRR
jgi:hypothetical protein